MYRERALLADPGMRCSTAKVQKVICGTLNSISPEDAGGVCDGSLPDSYVWRILGAYGGDRACGGIFVGYAHREKYVSGSAG